MGQPMPNIVRVAVAIVFFAVMAIVVRPFIHFVVDLGFIPWLAMMAGIFWWGISIENRDRARDGRPSYSWGEARELVMPLGILGAIIAATFLLR